MKVTEPVLKIPVTEIFSPAREQEHGLPAKNGKNTRWMRFRSDHICGGTLVAIIVNIFGTSMNGVSIYQDGARDIGEINGGVVGMITPEVAAFRLMQAFNLENMDTIIHLPC